MMRVIFSSPRHRDVLLARRRITAPLIAASLRYCAAAAAPASATPAAPATATEDAAAVLRRRQEKKLMKQQRAQRAKGKVATVKDDSQEAGTESTAVAEKKRTPNAVRTVPTTAYQSLTNVTSFDEFRRRFADVGHDDDANRETVTIAGRVAAMRHMGKVLFLTLRSNNASLQVMVRAGLGAITAEGVAQIHDGIQTGDVISAVGHAGKTKHGELTLFATEAPQVVAPYVSTDLVTCPDQRGFAQLQQSELRYRYRFLDMLSNQNTVDTFVLRHKVLMGMRQFLTDNNFVEVETPMFHSIPGGAAATPFITRHHATDSDLYLRVAPELYLKQCVVGGMERVFEIGRVFRNEDADYSHNPEFTSCEFYRAYATYQDLLPFTEDLIRSVAVAATGSSVVKLRRGSGADEHTVEVDFAKPFRRVRVIPALESALGAKFPPMSDLDTPMGVQYLCDLFRERNLPLPTVLTAAKLVDKLIDRFITDDAIEPVFVLDHPIFMSPLAKAHPDGSQLSERFELFVNGIEICNAYSELTDPVEQFKRFEQQMRQREMGDCESQTIDDTFLKALQVGLPPTAGWGMGIDRFVMLLSGASSIRDVIMFPLLRPDVGTDSKRRARTASFFGFDQHMTAFVLRSLEAELERRGEIRCCNQLRTLRHTMETALRRHEASSRGPLVWPAFDHAAHPPPGLTDMWHSLCRVAATFMCPRPRQ